MEKDLKLLAKIPFYKPPITEKEAQAAADVIKSGWMTTGEKTEQFEKKFAEYIGAPYCVMVSSCTDALNLSIAYWKEYKDKNKTITISIPSLGHMADASAVIWNGLNIKFEDLAPDESFCMAQTNNPSIPLHYAGLYNKQPLPIIEDSAHRIMPKSFTSVTTCYSFYANKNLTTGGNGGMIACASKEEMKWYMKARYLGINLSAIEREKIFKSGGKFWEFESEFLGYKCEPTDIQAAIGLIQLQRLNELNNERQRVAKLYNKLLKRNYDRESWHRYPILINKRDEFMFYMKEMNIHCSVQWLPLHQQKAFKRWSKNQHLPITDWIYNHFASLPFYPYMKDGQIERVVKAVLNWEKKYGRPQIKDGLKKNS